MRAACVLLLLCAVGVVSAQTDPLSQPHAGAQAAADVIRDTAGTDAAFLAAGLLKESASGDLASLLQYPTEEIVVVTLSGAEMRKAMERSLANYPQPNQAFLQISGVAVTFSQSAAPESRVLEITVSDSPLSATRQYTVAMPATLARGALGYFKIWDKSQITKSTGITLEAALKGKTGSARGARYLAKQ